MMKIAIVGGGLGGLVEGYRLGQKGHKVTVFEKSKDLGGLAGGFEINGTSLEKTYHHIFPQVFQSFQQASYEYAIFFSCEQMFS